MKEEDELYKHVATTLQHFPKISLLYLSSTCPDNIKQQLQTTTLQPSDINAITRKYDGPTPKATLNLTTQSITCNAATTLRNAYSSQQYRAYLQRKYMWADTTTDEIDWQVLSHAMARLSGNNKKIIQQFIHKWLPTNASKNQNKAPPHNLCPHCRTTPEDHQHFIHCWADQKEWKEQIQKAIKTIKGPPVLLTLIQCALTEPETLNDTGCDDDETPIILYTLCQSQHNIGWNHILCGRWSRQWVTQHDKIKWAGKLLHALWKTVIDKWQRRCTAEHAENPENIIRDTETLNLHIETIYSSADKLDAIDRQLLHSPIDKIKQMTNKQKRAWVRRIQPHVTTGLQRSQQQQKLNTQPITTYFLPKTTAEPATTIRPINSATARAADFDPP